MGQTPSDSLKNLEVYRKVTGLWDTVGQDVPDSLKYDDPEAVLLLGIGGVYIPGSGSQMSHFDTSMNVNTYPLSDRYIPGFYFSTLAARGRLEWNVGVPLNHWKPQWSRTKLFTGISCGLTFYPMGDNAKWVSPFVGVSVMPMFLTDNGWAAQTGSDYQDYLLNELNTPLKGGVQVKYRNARLDLSGVYFPKNAFDVYLETQASYPFKISPFAAEMRFSVLFNGVPKDYREKSQTEIDLRTSSLLSKRKLSGVTFSLGLAQGYYVRKSELYNTYRFLKDPVTSGVYVDVGLGYYFAKYDWQLNYSFRTRSGSYSNAFYYETDGNPWFVAEYNELCNISQVIEYERQSHTIEAYRFWGSWSDLALFAGPCLSMDDLAVKIAYLTSPEELYELVKSIDKDDFTLQPGVTFGWEIRPDRLQWMYIRSTFRWMPLVQVYSEEYGAIYFDQLEITGIQIFIKPGRIGPMYKQW